MFSFLEGVNQKNKKSEVRESNLELSKRRGSSTEFAHMKETKITERKRRTVAQETLHADHKADKTEFWQRNQKNIRVKRRHLTCTKCLSYFMA